MAARLLGVLLVLAGCYRPSALDSCKVQCGAAQACPDGTQCGSDGMCKLPGAALCSMGGAAGAPGVGDSGVGGAGSSGSAGGVSIEVSPGSRTLLAGTAVVLTATVTGNYDTQVSWAVVEAAGGSVTPDGVYSAPIAEGTFHVRATSHADPSRTADAEVVVQQLGRPVVLAGVGSLDNATGQGQQSHLAFARGSREWWLFYDSSAEPMKLLARHSGGFRIWQDGGEASLPLPHSNDGRNLTVAYQQLGGVDLVHVSQGAQGHTRYHLKGTLTSGLVTFGLPQEINRQPASTGEPDGAAAVITDEGLVIDSTGWLATPRSDPLAPCGTGDVVTYESELRDSGPTSFDDMAYRQRVLWCVPQYVYTRLLLASGGTVFHLFDGGLGGADAMDVLMMTRLSDGTWLPRQPASGNAVVPPSVFGSSMPFALNDWAAIVADGQIHAVRRRGADTYDHVVSDLAGGGFLPGRVIPSDASLAGSGMFLTRYGAGLLLVAIRDDGAIRYSFSRAAAFGPWLTLVGATSQRGFLSGYTPEGDDRPAIIWTQANGGSFDIVGLQLP